tara:strand:- start:14257 stop:16401 length:2145 start_codon:yes stop_codon:yes gene_type:complete
MGPFLDETDGKTAETGLTISQADVRLSKGGGNFAQKNESTSASHDEIGYYIVLLDATDTATVGELLVAVHESGALPVFKTFQVVEEAIYDAIYGGSADLVTKVDAIDTVVDAILVDTGTTIPATIATVDTVVDAILVDTGTTLPATLDTIDNFLDTEVAAILADTNELQGDWVNGGRLDLLIDSIISKVDVVDGIVDDILVDTGTTIPATIATVDTVVDAILVDTGTTIPATIATIDDFLDTEVAAILADTNELQGDWVNGGRLDLLLDSVISKVDVVDAIVDSILVDTGTTLDGKLDTIDNFLDTEVAAILADTNELQGDWVNGGRLDLLLDSAISKIDVVDGVVDSVLVDTAEIGSAGAGLTAIPWNASWDAEVQSEVADGLAAYDPPTKAELDSAFTEIKGGSFASTDTLEAIRDRGDAAWTTGGGGSAPTAAAVADAVWDEATSGHTTSGTFGEQVKTDIDAILVDTGTTLDGKIDVIDGIVDSILVDTGTTLNDKIDVIDGIVDSILVDTGTTLDGKLDTIDNFLDTEVAAILADTNELQTDWANGGRLDALLDSAIAKIDVVDGVVDSILVDTGTTIPATIATIDTVVDAILVDTAVIGAAGAGLTGIPWNASWDAEVQSEVADALAVYDPPTKAEIDAMWTTAQTESYASDGATATPAQLLYMILCAVSEFSISSTTITGKKVDGSTTAMTWTLDDATSPTSRTRAS